MKLFLLLLLHPTQVISDVILIRLSHPSTSQAAEPHNSGSTETTSEERNDPVGQMYNNPKQLWMPQETVWFEDPPSPRSQSNPKQSRSSKSSSSRGCWPLLHLNFGPCGRIPGVDGVRRSVGRLVPGVRGLILPPWGFHPTTASPVSTTSTSTRRSNVYLRL